MGNLYRFSILFLLLFFFAKCGNRTMSLKKQMALLILTTFTIIEMSAASAIAQNFNNSTSEAIKAQSPFEFAKENEGYVALMELSKNQDEAVQNFLKEYIPCQNEFCNRATQKCIRASLQDNFASQTSQFSSTNVKKIVCRCVGKNEDPSKYNEWFFSTFSTARYQDAPDGCDGTVSQNVVATAMDAFEYSTKRTCWNNSSDGKRYCMTFQGDEASVAYANESNKATSGCEVLPVKLYNYRRCFFCPLVGVIYDGSAKITDVAFAKMAGAFATLLAIGFAIWVALQVLTQVSSLTKQDAPKFLGSLIKQSYKVIIAFILLQNSQQIFEYAIRPILETGLVFGQNMVTTREVFQGLDYDNGRYIRQAKAVTGGRHFRLDTYDKLEQFVVAIQRHIAFMQAVGTSLICTGTNLMLMKEASFGSGKNGAMEEFGVGFQMFVQGAVLAIFGFLLSLAFVFYLIDAIVQFGVVGALAPFLIASWPFKATSKYTSTGVQMLLNSAFLFLFVGLVVSANVFLIDEALKQTSDEQQNELLSLCEQQDYFDKNQAKCKEAFEQTPRMGALFEIAQTLNSLDSTKLRELTDISAMGFLILLFCCIFGFKFTGQASPLADKFASGGIGKPIAPGIATMGASFAKSAAARATENIREAAGDRIERGAKWFIGLTPRGMKAVWRRIRGKNKKPASAGGTANPQTTGGNPAPVSNGSDFGSGRAAATLNEQTQTAQSPKLNEQTPRTQGTPVLNENQQPKTPASQPRPVSHPSNAGDADEFENDTAEAASAEDAEYPEAEENADSSENTRPSETERKPQSQAQNAQAYKKQTNRSTQPQKVQNRGQTITRPRRPERTPQKSPQVRNTESRGGSGHNRAKYLKKQEVKNSSEERKDD